MLRLNEVKLPLEHDETALTAAILARLAIPAADLLGFTVFKRSYDARKRSAVVLIYSLHVEVRNEAAVLARLQHDIHLMPAPDTDYKFVAGGEQLAGSSSEPRPIVIGTGPCGLFVALILAQMGLRPLILERGKQVRERTVDTFGFWRKRELNPGIERAVRRRRRRHLFGRQAVQPDQGSETLWPQGADGIRQGRRARRDHVCEQAAYRHLPPGQDGGRDARRNRAPGRRIPFWKQGGRYRYRTGPRRRPGARRGAGQWRDDCQQPRGAGDRPQRARHLRDAAPARRVYRGKTVFDRFPRRTPAIPDRQLPLRPQRRPPYPRRGRLQAGAPRQQWPLGLQLLHVPWRHGGGGRVRTGPPGDERHEPVFAQ